MRTAFIEQLIEDAQHNEKIFLLVGDLGFSVVEPFAELYPERYLNIGIAEQNMAGIAAGLAMEGYCVFIYSIGNFPTLRCMEQIRYDICYHNLNVKIIAVGGGYAYGSLGASHHATEELGMLRTIPNIVVCAPGDPIEAKSITHFASEHIGPCYIRIGKAGEPIVHQKSISDFTIGDILTIKDTSSTSAIFSTGAMLKYVTDFVKENELEVSVYSFPFVKPIDKKLLLEILRNHKNIVTIEEHQSQCGFGSAILEIANEFYYEHKLMDFPRFKRIAIQDRFTSISGSQKYLRDESNLILRKEFFDLTKL